MAKIEAKSGVETNFSDRPVRKRGTRHNSSLENKIVREAGSTGLGEAWQDATLHGRRGLASQDEAARDRAEQAGLDSPGRGNMGHGNVRQAGHAIARSGTPTPVKATQATTKKNVEITPPNFREVVLRVRGLTPYVQHAFSQKALLKMEETHRAGSKARTRKQREERNFEEDYEQAKHKSKEGWLGIPAPAFRNALISACKIVGFFQTRAKLALFVEADGIDAVDGTPMVKIIGQPEIHKGWGRNESGTVDLRWRPMWPEWEADVRIKFDQDMFSDVDVVNLMMRAGLQVGIGEGRPDSPNSNGMGWGQFEVVS
jgi:hypothetical protein